MLSKQVSLGGRIWLNATGYGDTMEISVRDDGDGMSDETRRSLFQPFFSTRGDLGNGLGLYISLEIIDRNGGSITVKTQSGVGTEMRLRLLTSPPSDH
jgi:signal transduction histidine kinase